MRSTVTAELNEHCRIMFIFFAGKFGNMLFKKSRIKTCCFKPLKNLIIFHGILSAT